AEGRHEPRGPASRAALLRRAAAPGDSLLRRAAHGAARHHGVGPGQVRLRLDHRGQRAQAAVRPLLREEHVAPRRRRDRARHLQGDARGTGTAVVSGSTPGAGAFSRPNEAVPDAGAPARDTATTAPARRSRSDLRPGLLLALAYSTGLALAR